jgi:TM2 domain-containing membrane protein YozV
MTGRTKASRRSEWSLILNLRRSMRAASSRSPEPPPRPRRSPHGAISPRSDRNKYVAAVLAFLLGPSGIHRFYLGRFGSGVAMLLLSVSIVGLLVSVPWALIDMIRYLIMTDRDFAERYAPGT